MQGMVDLIDQAELKAMLLNPAAHQKHQRTFKNAHNIRQRF